MTSVSWDQSGAEGGPIESEHDFPMELRHLRYFLAVAEELSFTRAAERLHIAQPPLSQQIRQIEEELGVLLIERATRPLRLTDAGALLLERARVIVGAVEDATEDVKRLGRGQAGRLVLAFVGSAMYTFLPELLNKFREKYPQIDLALHEMLAGEIGDALRERRIDVGFSRPPLDPDDDFEQQVLLEEPYVLAVPAKHRFAARESVDLHELNGEPLILYPRYPPPSLTDVILRACAVAGFAGRLVQEVRHMQTAIGLVAAGVGVTFVASSVRHQSRSGVCFVPICPPAPMAALSIVWRKGSQSMLLRNFLEVVEAERRNTQAPQVGKMRSEMPRPRVKQ